MKLGLSMRYMGYHVGSWRHPDVPAVPQCSIADITLSWARLRRPAWATR